MIKVGLLVSYDYKYLYKSLPLIYESADVIFLAIDAKRLTWSGNKIFIDENFFKWIKEIDIDKKITIYEDDFYIPDLSPSECDTRERQLLSEKMGKGGWHIQIDSDEYFYKFREFIDYLKSINHYLKKPEKNPVEIFVQWITLYKKVDGGFLFVEDSLDAIEIATNLPNYKYMRSTRHKKKIITQFVLLHQSWAREEEEIYTKITNWSHRLDSDNIAYFEKWKKINLTNYKEVKNFHERDPSKWKSLGYIKADELQSLAVDISKVKMMKIKIKKHIIQFIKEKLPVSFEQKIVKLLKYIFK